MFYSSQNTTLSLSTFGNETNCTIPDQISNKVIFVNPNSLSVFVQQKNSTGLQSVLTDLVAAANRTALLLGTDKSKFAFSWQDISGVKGFKVDWLTIIVQTLTDNIRKAGFRLKNSVQRRSTDDEQKFAAQMAQLDQQKLAQFVQLTKSMSTLG